MSPQVPVIIYTIIFIKNAVISSRSIISAILSTYKGKLWFIIEFQFNLGFNFATILQILTLKL